MATEQEMNVQRILNEADRRFEAGDVADAYGKLWEVSSWVVRTEMRRRGDEPESLKSMMLAVDSFAEENLDCELNDLFAVARACRSFAEGWFITDCEYEVDRPRVRRFVSKMLELAGESDV